MLTFVGSLFLSAGVLQLVGIRDYFFFIPRFHFFPLVD